MVVGLTIVLVVSAAPAQEAPLWRNVVSAHVERYDFSPLGSLLVQLKMSGLVAMDPQTGKHLWSRPDVSEYEIVPGVPFLLVKAVTGAKMIDLESGQDRWDASRLGLSSIKGYAHLSRQNLMLVHGETAESPHVMVAARYESGEVLWRQGGLYATPALAAKARKMYPHVLPDTENTVVLDPTEDGLIRLDIRSGQLLWRIAKSELGGEEDFSTLFGADGRVYAAYKKRLLAIDAENGKVLWFRKENFRAPVIQLASTPQGVLLRGLYDDERGLWRPFLALLDPATGQTKWTTENSEFHGRSFFVVEDNTVVIALKAGIATYDLASGKVIKSLAMRELGGGEDPCCLRRYPDKRLLVWSTQNLRMFDESGVPVYSIYLKAPGASFLAKFASAALIGAAIGAAGYAGGPGVLPTAASRTLAARYDATVNAERFTYLFTENSETASTSPRFSLVRIDKETGRETGRLPFAVRSPSFQVDPATGIVVVLDNNALFAMRFPTPHQERR